MSFKSLDIRISDLNPLRFAQTNMIDYNFDTSMFQNTLYTVNNNKFKYVQKYAISDIIRVQICQYGTITPNWYINYKAYLYNLQDELIDTVDVNEKTGTFDNNDVTVLEFEYTLSEAGNYYFKIDCNATHHAIAETHIYFVSEPILVSSSFNCLPKIIYFDADNYPNYDMYFSTGIYCQMRLEIGVNQQPQVDLTKFKDNVKNVVTLHNVFYDNYEVYASKVLPIWLARKFKFALSLSACYVNYTALSMLSNDEIENIEDGYNACTFKFKCQPNNKITSIFAISEEDRSSETTKDFTNICLEAVENWGDCLYEYNPTPANSEYWERAIMDFDFIKPTNLKNITAPNLHIGDDVTNNRNLTSGDFEKDINIRGYEVQLLDDYVLQTNYKSNVIITSASTPIIKQLSEVAINGKIIYVTNNSGVDITIVNDSQDVAQEYRITTGVGDYIFRKDSTIELLSDVYSNTWRIVGLDVLFQTKTRNKLQRLQNNGNLIKGCKYLCYFTQDILIENSNEYHTFSENYIFTANSISTFEPIVQSVDFPSDIIYRDLYKCYRRIDTIFNIDINRDFRHHLTRCYALNVTREWVQGETYYKGDVVTSGGEIHLCIKDEIDSPDLYYNWIQFAFSNGDYAFGTVNIANNWNINADINNYADLPIIDLNNCYDVKLEINENCVITGVINRCNITNITFSRFNECTDINISLITGSYISQSSNINSSLLYFTSLNYVTSSNIEIDSSLFDNCHNFNLDWSYNIYIKDSSAFYIKYSCSDNHIINCNSYIINNTCSVIKFKNCNNFYLKSNLNGLIINDIDNFIIDDRIQNVPITDISEYPTLTNIVSDDSTHTFASKYMKFYNWTYNILSSVIKQQITLTPANWSSLAQSVTVNGILETDTIQYSGSTYSDSQLMSSFGIFMDTPTTNTLNFTCINTPTSNIVINIISQKI